MPPNSTAGTIGVPRMHMGSTTASQAFDEGLFESNPFGIDAMGAEQLLRAFQARREQRPPQPRPELSNTTDKKFVDIISAMIAEGVDVPPDDLSRYLRLVKSCRHVSRDERLALHRPRKDGKKTTASLRVDDIAP